MKKNVAITALIVLLLGTVANALPPQQPFLPFYWVKGIVTKTAVPIADRWVTFYKDGVPGEVRAQTDANGNYALNAYELNYFSGVDLVIPGTYKIAVYQGPDGWGKNPADINLIVNQGYVEHNVDLVFGEGPVLGLTVLSSPSLPNATIGAPYDQTLQGAGGSQPYTWSISSGNLPPGLSLSSGGKITGTPTVNGMYNFTVKLTDSANNSIEKGMSIFVTYSIVDIPYGPQIRPSILFQALANTSTWSNKLPQIVRVEARSGTLPDQATTLVGYADLVLNENGAYTVGRNGFLKPDGTEFGANTPMADGDYYLAVKQWLTPTLVGRGHLSIITTRKIHLATVSNDRDGSTTRLDLTADPAVIDTPGSKIYNEIPHKPTGKPDALVTLNNRTMMRAGDLDGNNYVDVIDTSWWYKLFTKFNLGSPDDPLDPYIRADLDQNGLIDVIDTSWWYGTFNELTLILGDPGPHGYVPAIQ